MKVTFLVRNALKQIRQALGCNQQEIADKLSIEVRKLRSYEYETKNYPTDFLKALVNVLNVNLNWFFTNKGEMFIEQNLKQDDQKEPLYLSKKEINKLKELLKD